MSSNQTPEELFGNPKAKADCPSAHCSRWEYLVEPTPETATHCLRIDRIEIDCVPLPVEINRESIPREGHIYFREHAKPSRP